MRQRLVQHQPWVRTPLEPQPPEETGKTRLPHDIAQIIPNPLVINADDPTQVRGIHI